MSPKDDGFLSGALDHTVRLWDLRTCECQASGAPVVAGRHPIAMSFRLAATQSSELQTVIPRVKLVVVAAANVRYTQADDAKHSHRLVN